MNGSGGARVSIPSSVRKTIQNIKEITGNLSDDEIYAMLKECSMDPNETTQKLLLQDTFHEVKRKRDRRKENVNSKDAAESRWRPGTRRGSRGAWGSFSSRHVTHDAGGGRVSAPEKENGLNKVTESGAAFSSSSTSQDGKNKETVPAASLGSALANGPHTVLSDGAAIVQSHLSKESVNQTEATSAVNINKTDGSTPTSLHADGSKLLTVVSETEGTIEQPSSIVQHSFSGVYSSASDPMLMPSHDSRLPGMACAIKQEVGSQLTTGEPEGKAAAASDSGISIQGKMPAKLLGVGKNQLDEPSQPTSTSSHGSRSSSRISSNSNTRSQQAISPQKGPSKEWKPKPANPNVPASIASRVSEVSTNVMEVNAQPKPDLRIYAEEVTSKLENVIIAKNIHVPEAKRAAFSFGSFDATFGISTSCNNDHRSENSTTPISTTSEGIEETLMEPTTLSNNQNDLSIPEDGETHDHPQSPITVPENIASGDVDLSSNALPEYESKQETVLPSGHQYSLVHTSNYGFGFVPPMLGSQLPPFETESQARDVSRLPGFVVPQAVDPTSYYAQFFRSAAESDDRTSPFYSSSVPAKYNGNVAVVSAQTSQSSQEVYSNQAFAISLEVKVEEDTSSESGQNLVNCYNGGNSLVTAGPSPLVTQAAGVMQSSIAVSQQPVPLFRQPSGVHVSHYPPNYIPYGHYFPPFYVPPPAIHQFLSNGAFPQQPQAGNIYPTPVAAATGAKYPLSQLKPGANTGNPAYMGIPSAYGPCSSSPSSYNPSSVTSAGNSTTNEETAASQFKESNVYSLGQQSEGSMVWFTAPSRDIVGLQAGSFYNLPGQVQHVAFSPTQAGHGTFAGIYPPTPAVTAPTVHPLLQQSQSVVRAVDMVGPTPSVYQQPQHAQINWPKNANKLDGWWHREDTTFMEKKIENLLEAAKNLPIVSPGAEKEMGKLKKPVAGWKLVMDVESCQSQKLVRIANVEGEGSDNQKQLPSSALKIVLAGGSVDCYYMAVPSMRILEKTVLCGSQSYRAEAYT
ncbi:GBF-interacting protein 1, N-terminal [Dillenia turbinata]|uniref:GBF-interacting protein 1, N-terminal n=1 Tax=Dillenia turbinata TaxID=194707 RepID=A0AAN8UP33_9MAGN